MTQRTCGSVLAAVVLALAAAAPAVAQDLQQKLAAAKQAAAQSQQALRAYGWIEKVELSLEGEVKSTAVDSCRYGPDGRVQKTAVVEPPPPEKKRGLRGKVIEKKKGEMKAELEAATALVHQYIPPDPGMMQVVMNAGTASLAQAGLGVPQSPVTLRVAMQSLPDGTRYPGGVVLGVPASQIEVRITNSSYQKLAQ